jgi:hypothetical protein
VKGAPYSAEMVTTYDQVLPGGQRMHGETHGKLYRDSQGRTRTESDAVSPDTTAQKVVLVFINDPVTHTMVMLDPRTMIARVNPWIGAQGGISPRLERPAQPGTSTTGAGVLAGSPSATSAAAAPVGRLAAGGVLAAAANTEDLGTRDMQGVSVRGTRVSRTVDPPVGATTAPRTVVTTTWVSPDLQVAVTTETEDSQSGQRATKLVNIVRTEPDAALFQIPAGYTVADSRPQKQGVN